MPARAGGETRPGPDLVGVAVIELNTGFIVHQLFPALVQRHLNLSGTHLSRVNILDRRPRASDL